MDRGDGGSDGDRDGTTGEGSTVELPPFVTSASTVKSHAAHLLSGQGSCTRKGGNTGRERHFAPAHASTHKQLFVPTCAPPQACL